MDDLNSVILPNPDSTCDLPVPEQPVETNPTEQLTEASQILNEQDQTKQLSNSILEPQNEPIQETKEQTSQENIFLHEPSQVIVVVQTDQHQQPEQQAKEHDFLEAQPQTIESEQDLEKQTENQLKQQQEEDLIEKSDNELENGENNAVADVVAAVEQAVAAKQSNAPTKVAKKKPKTSNKNSNNNLNNSITSTINDIASGVINTSPSSAQKRRKKDPLAPKAPLNGYLVYFNEERAEMRLKNPNIGFGELTKIIAAKWKELAADEKQKYINEAELDKERYIKEMADYKKSDAYKQYLKENTQAKIARGEEEKSVVQVNTTTNQEQQPNLSWLQSESNIAGFDVPIFTEEFIEHSKSREQEVRQLRKEINEMEQQNSVLYKHIDNLKQSTQKIELDIEQFKNSNNLLAKNMDIFRQTILHCFSNTPLPNTQDYVPTPANIDDYIMRLFSLVNAQNQTEQQQQQHQTLTNDSNFLMNRNFVHHVKSVFAKINFSSLFEAI